MIYVMLNHVKSCHFLRGGFNIENFFHKFCRIWLFLQTNKKPVHQIYYEIFLNLKNCQLSQGIGFKSEGLSNLFFLRNSFHMLFTIKQVLVSRVMTKAVRWQLFRATTFWISFGTALYMDMHLGKLIPHHIYHILRTFIEREYHWIEERIK